jgi:hypothetical protein
MSSCFSRFVPALIVTLALWSPAFALPPWKPKFQELYVDSGPRSLKDAFADNVIGSCKVCHVNGQEKTVRNPFGEALDTLIEGNAGERLQAAGEKGDAAKAAVQIQLDKELLVALDKVLAMPSPSGGGTYGQRIKAGQLPFVPAATSDASLNTLTDQEKAEGWKVLFDGKTAAGWYSWKTKQPLELGRWVVADGALTLGPGGGDVYTEEAFENFELELEWKTAGNSGILIRVNPAAGGAIYGVAPEMQIERGMSGSKTAAAALYDIFPVQGEKLIHADGWNKVKIRLVDGEGTHWFNGHQVYSYKIGSDDWNSRIANSKWKNSKGFAETAKGHIGLQDHGAAVSFRNVKIRVLK